MTDVNTMVERLEGENYRGPMQHLRSWSEWNRMHTDAAALIRKQQEEIAALLRRVREFEVGIKRLSDEEELLAETTDGDMFSMVSLAAKLAGAEHREKELADMVRDADDSRVAQLYRADDAEAENAVLREALEPFGALYSLPEMGAIKNEVDVKLEGAGGRVNPPFDLIAALRRARAAGRREG